MLLVVTFEFLYGFGTGGNVLLQCALEVKTATLNIQSFFSCSLSVNDNSEEVEEVFSLPSNSSFNI